MEGDTSFVQLLCRDWGWKNRKDHLFLFYVITTVKALPLATSCIRSSWPMKGFRAIDGEGKFGGCSFTHLTDT